jgi:hypothetical protein
LLGRAPAPAWNSMPQQNEHLNSTRRQPHKKRAASWAATSADQRWLA